MGLITRRTAATVRAGSLTRRVLLRTAFAAGVIAGTAGALAPVLARRPGAGTLPARAEGPADRPVKGRAKGPAPAPERFTETYRGRHIQGKAGGPAPVRRAAGAAHPGHTGGATAVMALPDDVEVRIDGRPLHIMRRADGSYLSVVNHYESFPTLLAAARAAVDELGDAQLSVSPTHSL
ncbi:tyrosinase family oxidase copper chaperone [Streptomyces sp. Wb2n-11]|uniref:tyrosinase family oxidase copper chaperone n=1 Tax=Streptomyces sp. Wb2n-11 TaxID=1030533 RepID=UPI000AF39902|nr:tyrosinase family oxidase copper chaperone [Streptomyces sp. Wb2n-11]